LNFENLDLVAVYRTLRSDLQEGTHAFRIGMFYYFWGRLSVPAVRHGTPPEKANTGYVELTRSSLRGPKETALLGLADHAHAQALSIKDQEEKLAIIGYWSAVSYLCRYLATLDWQFADMASDSFLSALDELADSTGADALKNEMSNLTLAYESAQRFTETGIADAAHAVVQWAALLPLGSILPSRPIAN
jgi:hypothetical protein